MRCLFNEIQTIIYKHLIPYFQMDNTNLILRSLLNYGLVGTFIFIALIGCAKDSEEIKIELPDTPELSNENLGIVPQPLESYRAGLGDFILDNSTVLCYNNNGAKQISEYLNAFIKPATKLDLKIKSINNSLISEKRIILKISPTDLLLEKEEAYSLVSSEKEITIIGKSAAGLFYGVQSLFQILPAEIYSKSAKSVKWIVPSVKILDQPRFEKIRGLHVDVSRHFRTKQEMLEILDYMAMHKLNYLHWHLTDDEGWRIEIEAYPKLTEIGSVGDKSNRHSGPPKFYSKNEIRELIAYAKDRFIKIIPEVDMPGHMESAILSYPDLKSPNDNRDLPKVIRIDQKGREFCEHVLSEIDELFKPSYLHIGCDEINLNAKTPIYDDQEITEFVKHMATFVKSELGRTPIVWDDAFEKGWEDQETLVHWWRYGKVHWWKDMEMTIDEKVQVKNQPYILSPANYTYLDMKNDSVDDGATWAGIISTQKIYEWSPLLNLTNHNPSQNQLAQGIIAGTWSETIRTMYDFERHVFPRLAAISEKAWATYSSDFERLPWAKYAELVLGKYQLKRYKEMDLNYWSKN